MDIAQARWPPPLSFQVPGSRFQIMHPCTHAAQCRIIVCTDWNALSRRIAQHAFNAENAKDAEKDLKIMRMV